MTNRTSTPWNSRKGIPRQDQPQLTSPTVANGGCDLCVPQSWECTLRVNLYNPRCEEDIVHQMLGTGFVGKSQNRNRKHCRGALISHRAPSRDIWVLRSRHSQDDTPTTGESLFRGFRHIFGISTAYFDPNLPRPRDRRRVDRSGSGRDAQGPEGYLSQAGFQS